MTIVAILLPAAAILITYLFVLEVLKYRMGRSPISPRRFRLRSAAWLVAVGMCGAMFVGLFMLSRTYMLHHPWTVLILWSSCLVAAVALIAIMYADIKEVESGVQERQVELWRDFARSLAEKEKRRQGKSDQQEPPQA